MNMRYAARIVIAIPFLALVTLPFTLYPDVIGKRFGLIALAAAAAFFAIRDAARHGLGGTRPVISPVSVALLAVVAATLVSDILGFFPANSLISVSFERMDDFVLLAHLALFFFAAAWSLRDKGAWLRLFDAIFATAVVSSAYALLQAAHVVPNAQFSADGIERVNGTIGNSSHFAVFVMLALFLAAYAAIARRAAGRLGDKWIAWYASGGALSLVAFYLTRNKGAYLAIVFAVAVAGFLCLRRKAMILAATVAALLCVVVAFGAPNGSSPSSFARRTLADKVFSDQTFKARLVLWDAGMRGFRERPIFGWGQENYSAVFERHYRAELADQELWFDRAHNIVVEKLVTTGAVGTAALAALFAAALWSVWRSREHGRAEKAVLTGFVAAYLAHMQASFDTVATQIVLFAVFAYAHHLARQERGEGKPPRRTFAQAVTVAAGFALAASSFAFALRPFLVSVTSSATSLRNIGTSDLADMASAAGTYRGPGHIDHLTAIAFAVMSKPPGAMPQATAATNEAIARQADHIMKSSRYSNIFGTYLGVTGSPAEGRKYIANALAISPDKYDVLLSSAALELNAKDYPKALEVAARAHELYPKLTKGAIMHAIALLHNKKDKEAFALLKQRFGTDIVSNPLLVQAYESTGHKDKADAIRAKYSTTPSGAASSPRNP